MRFEINSFSLLKKYIASDLFRYMTSCSFKAFLRGWFIAGFRYTFFMRCCKYFHNSKLTWPFYFICRIMLRHYSFKFGFQIPWQTNIGPGLAIGHHGTMIVNPNSTIGVNCNIGPGLLIGLTHKVDDEGKSLGFEYPIVGNMVSFANNAKIIGGVFIGNRAVIGVNTVVTHDVSENAIMVGMPARQISDKGSYAYVGSFHPWTKQFL